LILAAAAPPNTEPHLPALLGWFVLLVAGLAFITRRPAPGAIASGGAHVARAFGFAAVYAGAWLCFARVLVPALLGNEHSPWLLALGDVIFVTTGLFAWLVKLAERRSWSEFGFRGSAAGRLVPTLLFGAGAAALFAASSYLKVASGRVAITTDTFVYSLLYASV